MSESPGPPIPPPVDPSSRVSWLAFWAMCQLFASLSQIVLLALSWQVPRIRRTTLLLHLQLVFLVSCATQSMLVWTGHAMDMHPPFALCLLNASAVIANVPWQAGAALILVTKVWTNALLISHPDASWISWLSTTSVLLALPSILAISIFWTAVYIGLGNRATVYRGSVFYCVLDDSPINTVATGIGVACMALCLLFAAWIATLVAHRAWRVRFARSTRHINLALVIRTLLYSLCAAIAVVVGIISALTTFAEPIPDMVLAPTGPAVFFIFASDKDILRLMCCCTRGGDREAPEPRVDLGYAHDGPDGPHETNATGNGQRLDSSGHHHPLAQGVSATLYGDEDQGFEWDASSVRVDLSVSRSPKP